MFVLPGPAIAYFLLGGLVMLLVACASPQEQPTPDIPATVSTQVKAEGKDLKLGDVYSGEGYKIRPPEGWELIEIPGEVTGFIATSDPDVELGMTFQANINIIREPVRRVTLEEYVARNKLTLPTMVTGHELIGESEATVNGQPAHFLDGTFWEGMLKLRNRQLLLLDGDGAFVVTATALESSWERHRDIFEASLRTFELD